MVITVGFAPRSHKNANIIVSVAAMQFVTVERAVYQGSVADSKIAAVQYIAVNKQTVVERIDVAATEVDVSHQEKIRPSLEISVLSRWRK